MKKIIALALALIMALSMGVVAFAATAEPCSVEGDHIAPGETIALYNVATTEGQTEWAKLDAHSKEADWKVSAKWTKGGALVDEVVYLKATDDDAYAGAGWYIVLNENYTITSAKTVEGTITFDGKKDNKKDDDVKVAVKFAVSNCLREVAVYEDKDEAETYEAENNTLYLCPEDENGYVKFNSGRLLGVTLNMVSEEKAFMYNDESAIDALTEKYPDAEIECYNFGGSPVFKNAAEFTLQADYADQYYVYTYTKGKLEAQDYEWNSIEGVYEWSTKAPTSYVISDVELVAAAEETKNPDTGANDVVGVAAALAVVSLVAAGAVSLKK